jgi:hypothetical protein
MMWASTAVDTLAAMAVHHARRALRDPTRADALLAAPLAAAAVVQALAAPIADNLAVGLAIGLVTTVPVAFRRSRPVAAALVSTAAGLIESGLVRPGSAV